MPRHREFLKVTVLISLATGLLTCPAASAIELRTTCGDRTVLRTVSLRAEQAEAEEPAQNAPQPAQETKGMLIDEPVVYESACGPVGVPLWPSCGERLWVEFEFLLWWREGRYFPPLVTTDSPGILPGATVLFGGDQLNEQARPGGRLEVGWWLDDCQCLGVGGHFVGVGESQTTFSVDSNELAFFARPFFDADPSVNLQEAQVIANVPLGTTGALNVVTDSDFSAADAFVRCLMQRSCNSRVDFLFGYQYGQLDESLVIETTSTNTAIGTLDVLDSFVTKNEFHGGHFGVQGDYRWGCWGVELAARFGFGNMRQQAILSGATSNSTQNSGLLVQEETNAGTHSQDEFSYMHDSGVKLAYYPTERIRLSVGYSLMFFSDVLRPGDQIDMAVDSRLFPPTDPPAGAVRPAFAFNSNHFYMHGLNFGLECRF